MTAEILAQCGDCPGEIELDGGVWWHTRIEDFSHEARPICPACVAHPGWATADESKRSEPGDVCRACYGSGSLLVLGQTWRPPSGSVTVGSWHCSSCSTNMTTSVAKSHRPGSSECWQDRLEREWSHRDDD